MTSVQDITQCPQCGYDGADTGFDCDTNEEDTRCRKCGYSEDWERKESSDGAVEYERRIEEGAGSSSWGLISSVAPFHRAENAPQCALCGLQSSWA